VSASGFCVTVLNLDIGGCFFGIESVGMGWLVGGSIGTMFSRLLLDDLTSPFGDDAGLAVAFDGDCFVRVLLGALRIVFADADPSGRRFGLDKGADGVCPIIAGRFS
jgi:hypothetical protein